MVVGLGFIVVNSELQAGYESEPVPDERYSAACSALLASEVSIPGWDPAVLVQGSFSFPIDLGEDSEQIKAHPWIECVIRIIGSRRVCLKWEWVYIGGNDDSRRVKKCREWGTKFYTERKCYRTTHGHA